MLLLFIIIIIIIITNITFFFGSIFYITYASKVRAACIIVPNNEGSKVPVWLSGRGRSCLVFARSGMFELGIVPKEFNLVSTQE